jgi:branched-chain amino acid transport system permease protein
MGAPMPGVKRKGMRPTLLAFALTVLMLTLPAWPVANNYILAIAVRALLFIALGQSWNVIAGIGGQLSLGHGVFFGVGAYATGMLFVAFGVTPWLGLFAGIGVALVVAAVMGAVTFHLRGIYFALATVVISLGFERVVRFYAALTGGDTGLSVPFRGTAPELMQWRNPTAFVYLSLAAVVLFYAGTRALLRSRLGFALQAVRDDEEAASAAGVNVYRTKMLGLILSAGMTALVGALYVQFYLSIDPGTAFGLGESIQIQLPSLIGGLGTAGGPVIGGALMIVANEVSNIISSRYGLQGADVLIYGALLLAVTIRAPQGILGALRASTLRPRVAPG